MRVHRATARTVASGPASENLNRSAVGFHSFGFLIPRFFNQFALRDELLGRPVGKQRLDFWTVLVQLAFCRGLSAVRQAGRKPVSREGLLSSARRSTSLDLGGNLSPKKADQNHPRKLGGTKSMIYTPFQ